MLVQIFVSDPLFLGYIFLTYTQGVPSKHTRYIIDRNQIIQVSIFHRYGYSNYLTYHSRCCNKMF